MVSKMPECLSWLLTRSSSNTPGCYTQAPKRKEKKKISTWNSAWWQSEQMQGVRDSTFMLFGLMQRTKKGLHLELEDDRKWSEMEKVWRQRLYENHWFDKCESPPLHLLHQLQQGLLELAADGGGLVPPSDGAALPHVTSSLLTCDLCVHQEQVWHHLDTHTHKYIHNIFVQIYRYFSWKLTLNYL